jgi:hypothetical protein
VNERSRNEKPAPPAKLIDFELLDELGLADCFPASSVISGLWGIPKPRIDKPFGKVEVFIVAVILTAE